MAPRSSEIALLAGRAPGAGGIRIVRLAAGLRDRIETAPVEAGLVHSVFERAVNLAWHDGALLTLHAPGPLAAPFAAAVDRLPRRGSLSPGMRVRHHAGRVEVGETALDWRGAAVVDTVMPEARGGAQALARALAAQPRPDAAPGLRGAAGRRARSRLDQALRRRDARAFVEGASALLGLGEGLTPAGDDCLVGALAAVHRVARPWLSAHPEIAASVGAAAAAATTAVGRDFVLHALAGAFSEAVIVLMTAESEPAAAHALAGLLAMGATSGADTVEGMRLALGALEG